jgi:hypothetical protein
MTEAKNKSNSFLRDIRIALTLRSKADCAASHP